MSETKLKSLRDLRYKLSTGQISERDMDGVHVTDTDGTKVALSSPDALAALDRRIAAEEGQA